MANLLRRVGLSFVVEVEHASSHLNMAGLGIQLLLILSCLATLCVGFESLAPLKMNLKRNDIQSVHSRSMNKIRNSPGTQNLLALDDINHFNGQGYSVSMGIGNGFLAMGLDTIDGCTFIMSNCFIPNTSCESKTRMSYAT